jgi:hypothetical protein
VAVRLQSWLQDQGIDTRNRIKVITFSSPEKVIGDDRFWDHVNTEIGGINVLKVHNDLDIVPNISVGSLAVYAAPQNIFSIKIPMMQQNQVIGFTESMMRVLLRYQQEPNATFAALVGESIAESVRFLHEMPDDNILEKEYREKFPEYVGRWIQEVYFPKILSFIPEPEVSQQCVEYLINYQKDHNVSKAGHPLIAQEITSFLRGSEEVIQSSSSPEERRMRFMHFIIRWGVNPIGISSLLRDVEMDWRKSIGLTQQESSSSVDSDERKSATSLASSSSIASLGQKGKLIGSIGSEVDDIEIAKKQSLKDEEGKGNIGPRLIPGWELEDVEDRGNCFYDAVGLQMEKINHSILSEIEETTLLRDLLRSRVQGEQFKDLEWADHIQIDSFVKMFDVILAVADTRTPEVGFTYYFLRDGEVITKMPGVNEIFLPQRKQILKIATIGNHFLSVINHPGDL